MQNKSPSRNSKRKHETQHRQLQPNVNYITETMGNKLTSNKNFEYKGEQVSRDFRKKVKTATIHRDYTTITEWAFYECFNLTKVSIPDTVTAIGYRAFYRCEKLQSVNLSSSLTTIGQNAFYRCDSLKYINITSSVMTIEEMAFHGCKSLQSVTFPPSITIGKDAFADCPNLNNETKQRISNNFANANGPTIKSNFQNGNGPTNEFKGETQRGWSPEYCGMTLQQIQNVLNHPCINEYSTMRDVVEFVVKPAMKQTGVSYALLLNQDKPLHADVMVSVSSISKS